MSQDLFWKLIFYFHTNEPKIFFQTGKWQTFFYSFLDCIGTLNMTQRLHMLREDGRNSNLPSK